MYNLKKIYRQKSSLILIVIFSVVFLVLIFLFKYIFVVQNIVEEKIFDKYKNREIIVYDRLENIENSVNNIEHVLFVYPDYQLSELKSENIGTFHLNFLLERDMPKLVKGSYPNNTNEIILPEYTINNGQEIELETYLNEKIEFKVDNTNITFKVVGIYKAENATHYMYYNLENIKELLSAISYSSTPNTRLIIDHYQNLDEVLNNIGYDAQLYDISGIEEIQIYQTILNLILLLITIIIIFILIIFIILSNILYNNSQEQRFIQYVLGYSNNKIAILYIDYYLKVLLVSFIISLGGYFLIIKAFNLIFKTKNLVLNSLFFSGANYYFLIPIILIILLITGFIYFIIIGKIKKEFKYT